MGIISDTSDKRYDGTYHNNKCEQVTICNHATTPFSESRSRSKW